MCVYTSVKGEYNFWHNYILIMIEEIMEKKQYLFFKQLC